MSYGSNGRCNGLACDTYMEGVSADGSAVVVFTGEPLVPWDTNGNSDLYKRQAGQWTLLTSDGPTPTPSVFFDAVSDDGSHVFFHSHSPMTADDNDRAVDLYQHANGRITGVSTGPEGHPGGFDTTFLRTWLNKASPDGSKVFFYTEKRLDPSDTDDAGDLYVREGGQPKLVTAGLSVDPTNHGGSVAGMTADGRAEFLMIGEQMVPGDRDTCVDIYRRVDGVISDALPDTGSPQECRNEEVLGVTEDGSVVFFDDGTASIHRATCGGGVRTVYSGGAPYIPPTLRDFSADGRRVFFTTEQPLVASDTDREGDLYLWEEGRHVLIGPAFLTSTSRDGSRAVLSSNARLTPDDVPNTAPRIENFDVYLWDNGALTLISKTGGDRDRQDQGPMLASDEADRAIFNGGDGTLWEWTYGRGLTASGIWAESGWWASDDLSHFFFRTMTALDPADSDGWRDIYDWRLSPPPTPMPRPTISACLAAAGPAGGAGGSGEPVGPISRRGPRLGRVRVIPRRFRLGRRLPRLRAAVRRGAVVSFRLSERARVRLVFTRRTRCRKQGTRRCTRRRRGGSFALTARAGRNRVRFQGRVSRKRALRPGRYRLAVKALDPSGRVSSARSARFRLLAARARR